MAASIAIEEEWGTHFRSPHPHNGYYAGDFRSSRRDTSLPAAPPSSSITSSIR